MSKGYANFQKKTKPSDLGLDFLEPASSPGGKMDFKTFSENTTTNDLGLDFLSSGPKEDKNAVPVASQLKMSKLTKLVKTSPVSASMNFSNAVSSMPTGTSSGLISSMPGLGSRRGRKTLLEVATEAAPDIPPEPVGVAPRSKRAQLGLDWLENEAPKAPSTVTTTAPANQTNNTPSPQNENKKGMSGVLSFRSLKAFGKQTSETNVRSITHVFEKSNFSTPTWCQLCNNFIWGLHNQGYYCTQCKAAVHKKCYQKVKDSNCVQGVIDESKIPSFDPNSDSAQIHLACIEGNSIQLRDLLKKKTAVNALNSGFTPLLRCALTGELVCLELLLGESSVDMYSKTPAGLSVMHLYAQIKHENTKLYQDVFKKLLDKGASIYSRDPQGNCPIHLACACGSIEAVKLFLQSGFYVDLTNNLGQTCLHLAVLQNDVALVEEVMKFNADRNLVSKDGTTPLDVAERNHDLFQLLADVPAQLVDFYIAIKDNDLQLLLTEIEIAFEKKLGFDIINEAIIMCAIRGHLQLILFFLEEKFKTSVDYSYLNRYHLTAFLCLIRYVPDEDEEELYLKLLEKFYVGSQGACLNHATKRGDSPLHIASLYNNESVILFLLSHNTPVNISNNQGETELHYAVLSGNPTLVQVLLEHGSDPNIQSLYGESPEHLAQSTNSFEMLPILQRKITRELTDELVKDVRAYKLTVNSGTKLIAPHTSGKNEVFVVVKHYKGKKLKEVKTNACRSPGTPRWDQTFTFITSNLKKENFNSVELEVFDKRKDELLGTGDLDFSESAENVTIQIFNGASQEGSLTLSYALLYPVTAELYMAEKAQYRLIEEDKIVAEMKKVTGTRSVGEAKAKLGFKPKYPVLIIPGLASSALEAIATDKKPWRMQRIWIDPFKIGNAASQQFINAFVKKKDKQEQSIGSRVWMKHIMTAEDGWSDPPGIKIRPVEGLHGIDYLLEAGSIARSASYVFSFVIDALVEVGYDTKNLTAAPYDWRIPPSKLEERDGYFTKLKNMIEALHEVNEEKVVLLAHSMGNRCTQYFLDWVQKQEKGWIDAHVHAFLALGAPFLGATKSVRAVISGDCMTLDMFLTIEEGRELAARAGSTPWLFPLKEDLFPDVITRLPQSKSNQSQPTKLTHQNSLTTDSNKKLSRLGEKAFQYAPSDSLSAVKQWAQCAYKNFTNFYENNDHFLKVQPGEDLPPVLKPPPVRRLWVINGINVPTEVTYYFKHHPSDQQRLILDSTADSYSKKKVGLLNARGLKIVDGIGYETKDTFQPSIRANKSGDGTVPYASLNYATVWKEYAEKNNIPLSVEIIEIVGAKHREMLSHDGVLNAIIDFVCVKDFYNSTFG